MLESSQVCLLCAFCPIHFVKESTSSCQRRRPTYFRENCRRSDFGVCPSVLSLRSHQARVTVIWSALYWCVHVCVACIPSQWWPVNMWGGHGLIKCAEEKNSIPFVLQKQRWLWIHYFTVACQGVRLGGLTESRHCGLIKPNSCWFVLVEQIDGGGKERGLAVKGQ